MLFSAVYRWFTKFSSGPESVKDAPYSERPRAVTKSDINTIKSINEKDAHFTARQLAQMTNLGLTSVHFILKKGQGKISARWSPSLLTDKQKRTRVQIANVKIPRKCHNNDAQPTRGTKRRRDKIRIMTKLMQDKTPSTHKERRTATKETSWNGQQENCWDGWREVGGVGGIA